MAFGGLFCVFILAGVSAESLSSEEEKIIKSAKIFEPRVFYIYPRTGRLFHADYVRDNEIFRSLERTNFMRRGRLASKEELRRTKRDGEEESLVKKYTYVDAGRIPGEKKSVLGKFRDDLKNKRIESSFSQSIAKTSLGRIKREVVGLQEDDSKKTSLEKTKKEEKTDDSPAVQSVVEETDSVKDNKKSDADESIKKTTDCAVPKDKEVEVEEDLNSHPKNNDTDKTLFVQDSIQKKVSLSIEQPNLSVVREEPSLRTVLNEGIKLYPVYEGVRYTYPRVQRSLLYAPEVTVQMDNPDVKEYLNYSKNNTSSELQEEAVLAVKQIHEQ